MAITYGPKFGDFVYADNSFNLTDFQEEPGIRGATGAVPRSNIAASRDGLLASKSVVIEGMLHDRTWTSREDFEDAKRALIAAHKPGFRPLYYYSERYLMAEIRGVTSGPDKVSSQAMTLRFEAADPYWYATTEDADTWSSPTTGGTHSVSNGGSASAAPKFTYTFGSSATLALTLTDTSLSSVDNYFTLAASITSGDVLEIDCLNQTVILTPSVGSPSYKMEYFDGTFFEMDPGSNTLELIFTGPDIDSMVTSFRKRYL
jgi:phage-related protein